MANWTRRKFLLWTAGAAAAGVGGFAGVRWTILRKSRHSELSELPQDLKQFVDDCFGALDRSRLWDSHVHLLGLGDGGSGAWVAEEMSDPFRPFARIRYDVFREACGLQRIDDAASADAGYVDRLLRLQEQANPDGRLLLFAFDQFVDETGLPRPERSSFFTPNSYVLQLASQHEALAPCASIHPYRTDALERLRQAIDAGAVAVKWLPNGMGIDPSSRRCDAFYAELAREDVPLIVHGGSEYALDAGHGQELGNPLLLRRALDRGVRVVIAHCASLGAAPDLDAPEKSRGSLPAFRLFERMMDEESYRGRLFGDISALTQWNRPIAALRTFLSRGDLHERLLNGSDYPVPAVKMLFSTHKLQWQGLLGAREEQLCSRLVDLNPLLFDFCLKRCLRIETAEATTRFADSIFETASFFARNGPMSAHLCFSRMGEA